jgi:hypothetical protein
MPKNLTLKRNTDGTYVGPKKQKQNIIWQKHQTEHLERQSLKLPTWARYKLHYSAQKMTVHLKLIQNIDYNSLNYDT